MLKHGGKIMVVQHNLRAMNSNRMLGLTASVQSKSTEKLSSGYKINRAADDAAGLSISEKMRKQIRGLTQASLNAADGISAVQTAEGALNEVQDMLQRMNELAVKASNGTMSEDDRNYIQDEIDQLVTEIDRVAETTKFNETYLLKGDTVVAGTTENVISPTITTTDYNVTYDSGKGTDAVVAATGKTFGTGNVEWFAKDSTTAITAADLEDYFEYKNGGIQFKEGMELYTVAAATNSNYGAQFDSNKVSASDISTNLMTMSSKLSTTDDATGLIEEADLKTYINADGTMKQPLYAYDSGSSTWRQIGNESNQLEGFVEITETSTVTDAVIEEETLYEKGALTFKLHVGADSSNDNQITVDIQAMDATSLGLRDDIVVDKDGNPTGEKTLLVNGKTDDNARNAIDVIAEALQKVSEQRSALGAVQNRLEHTIANLDNVVENTTAAESQIRDTDMATEMVKYSNNNILAQAGQAMLAQANQANQGVLSLLG